MDPGNLNVTVADSCFISCPKTGIKVILQYLEEGWLGKAQNKVEGVIFRYTPATETITRLKDVPDKDILGRVEGCWHDKVYYTLGSESFGKNKVSHAPLYFALLPLVSTEWLTSRRKGQALAHRPQPALPNPQTSPTRGSPAPERIPTLLVRRHRRHQQQAVLPRHAG